MAGNMFCETVYECTFVYYITGLNRFCNPFLVGPMFVWKFTVGQDV